MSSEDESEHEEPVEKPTKDTRSALMESLFGSDSDDDEPAPRSKAIERSSDTQFSSKADDENEDADFNASSTVNSQMPESPLADSDQPRQSIYTDRAQPLSVLDIQVPSLPRPPQGAKTFFMKLPNIFAVENKPFSAETYEDEDILENQIEDDEGKTRLKLRKDNVIRWRHSKDEEGNITGKDSNARLVTWSDGSRQLLLGSEVFDVVVQHLSTSGEATNPDSTRKSNAVAKQFYHLFVRDGTGVYLCCHGRLDKKMIFRPTSLLSKSHRKLTAVIQQNYGKEKKLKLIHANKDPEKELESLEKAVREKNRNIRSMEAKQRRKAGAYDADLKDFIDEDENDDRRKSRGDEEEEEYAAEEKQHRSSSSSKRRPAPVDSDDEDEKESVRRILSAKDSSLSLPPASSSSKKRPQKDEVSSESEPSSEEEEELLPKNKKSSKRRVVDE